jgi:group I intron endonuclease
MILEVYKIINNKNGKIYVGITNQGVAVRWCKHCSDANRNSTFSLHNAIRKYGKDNFKVEVIETVNCEYDWNEEEYIHDYDYLKEREIYWIKFYNSYNRKIGYNLTLGGDGTFGRFHSEETKDKIRQKHLGRKLPEELKDRLSEIHKNRSYDHDEMSKRAKKGNKKRWSNLDNRINFSINNANNKIILQYDLEMNFINEYRSASEAARKIGKTHGNISNCAKGKLKTAYGFIWKYKDINLIL